MKVLIVDDSIVFRTAIKTALMASDFVTEVDVAANGKIALDKIKQNSYDGVTLDLEMPVMDGVESIKEIRKFNKEIPIIIFSAQNVKAANKTLEALRLGANDFVQKITGNSDVHENLKMIENELVPRFKAMIDSSSHSKKKPLAKRNTSNSAFIENYKAGIVCISSSTGGPDTLMNIFRKLNKLKVPVVLVQHIPPIFSTQLSLALDKLGDNTVKEAKDGDILEAGVCYLAPGDYHMEVVKHGDSQYKLSLNQEEKVCYVRPAADVMLRSVAKNFRGHIASFVLTGMGSDSANGCKAIKDENGLVVVQDEASSIVWGMPGAVVELDACDEILEIEKIVDVINKIAS